MKKIIGLFSFVVVLVLGIGGLSGCNTTLTNVLKTDKDILGFSVVSSANVLNEDSSSQNLKAMSIEENTFSIDMDQVDEYVLMLENLLVDGGPVLVTEEASDRDGYTTKLTYSVKELNGTTATYTVYYNQVLEIEDDDDDDDDKRDEEKEYSLSGIAFINDEEFTIIGEKEYDEEDNEYELEIKIIKDKDNYITISQEFENDEVEYEYTVHKDGKKVLKISMEIENNNQLEIKFTTTENGYKESYKFSKEVKDSKTIIKIKYLGQDNSLNIFVNCYTDSVTNEVIYEYTVEENNHSYKYVK